MTDGFICGGLSEKEKLAACLCEFHDELVSHTKPDSGRENREAWNMIHSYFSALTKFVM